MAGLLAARVVSEFYEAVTVIERDRLPDGPTQRKGIPQGPHLHNLMNRGTHVLEELFPGFLEEIVAAGANVIDDGDLSRVYARFGRYGLNRSGKFADPSTVAFYLASRPFLEFHVRRRVSALANVRFLDAHEAVEPLAATADRVTGVLVVERATGVASALSADLVVDAMGRAARTPAFLEKLGYGRPVERRSAARANYSSQLLRIPEGLFAERLIFVQGQSAGGGLLAYEGGTWILSVGRAGAEPPTDFAGMIEVAEQFAPPSVVAGLRSAEPVGDVAVFRFYDAVWRRYDRMPRFPVGLLVMGDALCTLNPIYGQGMTLAALEALALQDYLRGDSAVSQEYFRAAAEYIGPTWAMNQANDGTQTPAQGWRAVSRRLANWVVSAGMTAAERDMVLTERFFRVAQLFDPPSRLRDPSLFMRVILGNLRRRTAAATGG
jgi:2-polyprenyl-6-methoxyphenol hydroxylase-like FAD-dependent oxidoreductase